MSFNLLSLEVVKFNYNIIALDVKLEMGNLSKACHMKLTNNSRVNYKDRLDR